MLNGTILSVTFVSPPHCGKTWDREGRNKQVTPTNVPFSVSMLAVVTNKVETTTYASFIRTTMAMVIMFMVIMVVLLIMIMTVMSIRMTPNIVLHHITHAVYDITCMCVYVYIYIYMYISIYT